MDYLSGRNEYLNYLSKIPNNSFRGYKIGLDCANGASFAIARNVFSMLGADVFAIGARPDGKNINVDCGSTHPQKLQQYVVENGLDIGFAFDGDDDRCIAVDEKGNLIDGDGIIYIIAKHLKETGELAKDSVVVTVMSNIGLLKALKNHGISTVQTDVGDKYVAKEMFSNGFVVGGEQSGHIILGNYATTGDGILTALMLTNILVDTKNIASALVSGLTIYPQALKNIPTSNKTKIMTDNNILAFIDKLNTELGGNGRVLLRASGTEPMVRIMAEAGSNEECELYIAKAEDIISPYL